MKMEETPSVYKQNPHAGQSGVGGCILTGGGRCFAVLAAHFIQAIHI
ncbi:MAG: hypothetical protein U5L09_09170 [Bacteroidales bacterium]|nr:hypothetical protein [Bacteroidales bacterium]